MSGTEFQTFMVGGLGLLVAAALVVAWLLWRQEDYRREAIKLSLEGIGHEFRFNMFQTVRELADVEHGRIRLARDIPVLAHPQLDAVLAQTMATDKRPLAAIQATYQNVEAAKRRLRYALDEGETVDTPLADAKAATVHGISTLYLWEKHEGAPPARAHTTRSWWVRDWMKQNGFSQDLLPGLALRDSVVEDLRREGMTLTPKPLMLSAHEYYSRHYDRHADPQGVFGRRRAPKAVAEPQETEAEPAPPAEEEQTSPAAAAPAEVVTETETDAPPPPAPDATDNDATASPVDNDDAPEEGDTPHKGTATR